MYQPPKRKEGRGAERLGRKFQILTALIEADKSQSPDHNGAFTTAQIAKWMNMSISNHLRELLRELASENAVICLWSEARNKTRRETWKFNQDAWFHPDYQILLNEWYYAKETGE